MAVQRIPKELRYKNDLYKKTSAEITALAKERADANKKRIAAKKKTGKTKKATKTLFDTKEYKKAIKEINRQTEIYGSVRSSKINQMRRIAKKAGYSVSSKTLGIPTARQLSGQMKRQLNADLKSLFTFSSEIQRVRMQQKIKEVEHQTRSLVEQYELQLEQIMLELRGGEVPDQARKLYELMKGLLLEGMSAAEQYSQRKAEKMYEYTIKVVDEPVTWMKYAMRLLNYLPDIESVIERYMYSSDQSYIIYNFGGGISYNDENRYECWNKVIRIFWENVFDDSQFYMWMQTATAKEKKAPTKAAVQRTMFETYVEQSTADSRFAMDLDTSGLD